MLAIGRRVLVVSIGLVTACAMLLWALAPDVNSYRAEIEAFLKQDLSLQQVNLGKLSWYWAGHLGVRADDSSFSTLDHSLSVDRSTITVNISVLDFLSGKITPSGVHLRGGKLQISLDGTAGRPAAPLPDLITLKEMRLEWRYKGYSGILDQATVVLDSGNGELQVRIPGTRIDISLDEKRMPARIGLSFSDMSCLPDQLKRYFDGGMSGRVTVREREEGHWVAHGEMNSTGAAPAALHFLENSWQFESIAAQVELSLQEDGTSISSLEFKSIDWALGGSSAHATVLWSEGILKVAATSPRMAMPLVWQGLRPFGGSGWHTWLASMNRGIASEVRAEVELPWSQLLNGAPEPGELASLRYRVDGHVEDADISLGLNGESISSTAGDVDLDEKGLKAVVASTRLPRDIGVVGGDLHIPWDTLVLEISGRGDVDAGKLHHWMDRAGAEAAGWGQAPSKAKFSIRWMPNEEMPRDAYISLTPVAPWKLQMNNVPVEVDAGKLSWRYEKGIEFSNVAWATPHLRFMTDVTATMDELGHWQVLSMRSSGEGSLADLTTYFLLPVESASGRIGVTLDYDGKWHGKIDLTEAAWKNFLGTEKSAGEESVIELGGENGFRQGESALVIQQIHCKDKLLRLEGSGDISSLGLRLNLGAVETASFSGSVNIQAPFGSEPWELDINAAYLNRNALPLALPKNPGIGKKHWALRAQLKRFVWDDAEINDAEIKLASALNSVAVLKAGHMRSGEMSLSNLTTFFSMPGGGVVDLRKLEAEVNGLRLELSATLTPEAKRGMRWRGFAGLKGDFGDMMKRAGLSDIFEHGQMHVLFSGQGEVLSDQPWWKSLEGRMRMRVNNGRIMKGGTLSKFFAAISITDLPSLFIGSRDDLTKPGLGYKRLQMEAVIHENNVQLYNLAMRASAMDISGKGAVDIETSTIDMTLVMRPFQNLDALLGKVPILRDIFGGEAHSFIRRVYRMHGPISDAEVERISPEDAGLASPGMIERLLNLPSKWFGEEEGAPTAAPG